MTAPVFTSQGRVVPCQVCDSPTIQRPQGAFCHRCRDEAKAKAERAAARLQVVSPRPARSGSRSLVLIGEHFEWSDPPAMKTEGGPRARTMARVDEVVRQLQERPGVWARVIKDSPSSNAGMALEVRGCELAHRATGKTDRRTLRSVWARWPADGGAA